MKRPGLADLPLLAAGPWRPIPDCPGRQVWRGDRAVTPRDLLGPDVPVQIFDVHTAADPVHVALLDDGGVISYARRDGIFVHTLNTPEGLSRKLAELGIEMTALSRSAAEER
jgi:hypothetical protein